PCLGIVNDKDVNVRKGFKQGVKLALNPELHGVAGHQPGPFNLRENLPLQPRVAVPQKHELCIGVRGRQLWLKTCENIELSVQGLGVIQIVSIPASPSKCLSLHVSETL